MWQIFRRGQRGICGDDGCEGGKGDDGEYVDDVGKGCKRGEGDDGGEGGEGTKMRYGYGMDAVIFDILEPSAFQIYSTCWPLGLLCTLSLSLIVTQNLVFSCPQQLNSIGDLVCPLVPLSDTTNNQSLHNTTE